MDNIAQFLLRQKEGMLFSKETIFCIKQVI